MAGARSSTVPPRFAQHAEQTFVFMGFHRQGPVAVHRRPSQTTVCARLTAVAVPGSVAFGLLPAVCRVNEEEEDEPRHFDSNATATILGDGRAAIAFGSCEWAS